MAIQDFTAGQVLTAAQMDALQANDYNQTVSNKTASYTLVAADKGTRVVMSNAGATSITVNSGLFAAGDTLILQNIGAGVCTVTAGTCTVTTAGSLTLSQWASGTLYFTSASAAIFLPSSGLNAVSALDVSRVTTGQATTSTTYTGLTTAQTITMTTGTKALVLLSYNSNQERDIFTYASVAVSGATTTAASDANSANFQQVGVGGYTGTSSTAIPLTLTAGSNTFTMQFRNSSTASVTYSYRAMTVIAYS